MGKKIADKLIVNIRENVADRLAEHIRRLLCQQEGIAIRPLIALCIGSDRYTGDALGPLVGSFLAERGACTVYGSLDHPVHAGNLLETVNIIAACHRHPVIIAVDACLGRVGEIGNIEVWEGGIEAGIAVGNRLPPVGHISVIGVVNAGGQFGYLDLQSTPLAIVIKLSRTIGEALVAAIGGLAAPEAAAGLSPLSGGGKDGPTSYTK